MNEKNQTENSLKRFLKKKISYTAGLLVSFLITGTVGLSAATDIIDLEAQLKSSQEMLLENIQTQKASVQELLDANEVRLREVKNNHMVLIEKGDYYSKSIYPSTQIFFNYGWESVGRKKDRTHKEHKSTLEAIKYTMNNGNSGSGSSSIVSTKEAMAFLLDGNGTVANDERFIETISIGANIVPAVPKIPVIAKDITVAINVPDLTLGNLPNPSVTPIQGPQVTTPTTINPISTPGTPSVTVVLPGAVDDITIVAPNVNTPSAPNVDTKVVIVPPAPSVAPVNVLTPSAVTVSFTNGNYAATYNWHSKDPNTELGNSGGVILSNVPSTTSSSYVNGYIGFWGVKASVTIPQDITVTGSPSRAIIIDEMLHNTSYTTTGTITLTMANNIAIDLQGTHRTTLGINNGSWANPVVSNVINAGNILGKGLSDQLGIGFNNFDRSYNGTLTRLQNSGNIIMDGEKSLAIQLKPELYNGTAADGNIDSGKVLMQAKNISGGEITMNGDKSYGLSTIGWGGVASGNIVATSGEFGRHSDPNYISGLFNNGDININGKNSVGIALLYPIQHVENESNGVINVTASTSAQSVGMYAGAETDYVEDSSGSRKDTYNISAVSGVVGTKTVENNGTINISGATGENSGVMTANNGSVTNNGTINVSGSKNYGAVQNSSEATINIGSILVGDIGAATPYSVTDGIGFVLLDGSGSNSGLISVYGDKSVGVYGEKGIFSNAGTIKGQSATDGGYAVAVNVDGTTNITVFDNNGIIEVLGKGDVAIYATGSNATFTHKGAVSNIKVSDGSTGVFVQNNADARIYTAITVGTGADMAIGAIIDGGKITFDVDGVVSTANLDIKANSVGIYSTNSIGSTLNINKLDAKLGNDGVLAYYDRGTGSINITNATLTSMGSKSNIVYADKAATETTGSIIMVTDTTNRTFTGVNGINEGAVLYIANGYDTKLTVNGSGTMTVDTRTAMAAQNESTLINQKSITMKGKSGRTGDAALYANKSTVTNDISTGTIEINGPESIVGIFGENNSVINNDGIIKLNGSGTGNGDIGIYAKNSSVENSGVIQLIKDKSVGIYLDNSDLNLSLSSAANLIFHNSGGTPVYTSNSVGVYLNGEKTITVNGSINFESPNDNQNILFYTINKGKIDNKSVINVNGIIPSLGSNKTIGIYLDGSGTGENTYTSGSIGTLNVTNEAVGIYSKDYNVMDFKLLTVDGASTVGAYLNGDAKLSGTIKAINNAVGIYGDKGKVAIDGTTPILNLEMATNGVGIYLYNGSYATGGDITVKNAGTATDYKVGVYYNYTSLTPASITHDTNIILDSSSKEVIGIYAGNNTDLENDKNINIKSAKGIGAIAGDSATYTSNGTIDTGSTTVADIIGMYTASGTIKNIGTMDITFATASSTGVVAIAKAGDAASVTNTGSVLAGGNTGIYLSNSGTGTVSGVNDGSIATTTGAAVFVEGNNSSFDSSGGTINVTGSSGIGLYLKDTIASAIDLGTVNIATTGIGVYGKNAVVDFDVSISGSNGAVGVVAETSTVVSGDITMNDNGIGLYIMDNSVLANNISIDVGLQGTGIALEKSVGVYGLTGINISASTGIGIYLEKDISPIAVDLTLTNSTVTVDGGTGIYVDENSRLTTDGVTLDVLTNPSNIGIGVYISTNGVANIGTATNLDTINFVTAGGIGIYNSGGTLNLGANLTQNGNGTIAAVLNGNFSYGGTATLSGVTSLLGIYDGSMTGPNTLLNTGNLTITNGGVGLAAIKGISAPSNTITMTNNGTINVIDEDSNGQPSIALYTDVAEIINNGNVVVSNNSLGIYTASGKDITNNNITIIGNNGIGLYIKDSVGTIVANNITSTTSRNTGIVVDSITSGVINMGSIFLGEESVGFLSNGTTATIDGSISVDNGSNTTRSVGTIVTNGSNVTVASTSSITVGNKGIGAYVDGGSTLNINGSTLSVGTEGIYVYSEGGNIILNGGTITSNGNIGMIFDGGTFTNIGGNIVSSNGGIGIYVKNNDVTSLPNNMVTVQGGGTSYTVGIYYNNTSGVVIPVVNYTGNNIIGVVLNNSSSFGNNVLSMGATGINQIGVVVQGTSSFTQNADININGDSNMGIYGNSGNIAMNGDIILTSSAMSSDMSLSSIGVYLNGGNYVGTGNIVTGDYNIGVYGKNLSGVSSHSGNISIGNNSIGTYVMGTTGSEIYNVVGNISSGDLSIGLYNKNINATVAGNISIGDNGAIGIVSESNGDVNYTGSINVGNGGSLGIYKDLGSGESGIVNTSVSNWTIGDNGYGIYAVESSGNKTGSMSINNNASMNLGMSALGIYASGNINLINTGNIVVGATDLGGDTTPDHSQAVKHLNSVGIYMTDGAVGINSGTITSNHSHSLAAYITGDGTTFTNNGTINIDNGAVGMLIRDGATGINNGQINMGSTVPTYDDGHTVGMAAYGGTIVNNGKIVVGAGIGMMVGYNGYLNNQGIIEVYNGVGIQGEGTVINKGTIVLKTGSAVSDLLGVSAEANVGSITITSAGVITVNDKYVSVGGTLTTDGILVLDGAYADVTTGTPLFAAQSASGIVNILPNFALTGNGKTYEIENFVKTAAASVTGTKITPMIGPLFVAKITDTGSLIIVKRPYADVTVGDRFDTLYTGWDNVLESDPFGNDSIALKGMNAYLAGITDTDTYTKEAARMLSETRGDIYATIQKRMANVQSAFDASFDEMLNSYNFTKDTSKYSIIYRQGEYKDSTLGIDEYDYSITGLMYMKEYEGRDFKNKWGYTFGFAVSKFKFDDSPTYNSKSEEDMYSVRAGVHNIRTFGNDGCLKLISKLEFGYNRHEAKRKLEMETLRTNKGKYDTYSVTFDNKLEKTLYNNFKTKVDIYGALNMEYGVVNGFSETTGTNGGMLLEIKDNDYFSIQPELGITASRRFYLGKQISLKVATKLAYAYELGENYDGNKVRTKTAKGKWTNLVEPEKEEGIFKGSIGLTLEKANHYGVTFEVERGEHSNKKSGDTRFGLRFNYKFMND